MNNVKISVRRQKTLLILAPIQNCLGGARTFFLFLMRIQKTARLNDIL